MAMMHDMRFLSPPVRVHWLGWESTTAKLGRYGWDLSVQEDPQVDRIQIALRHAEAQVYGMSEVQRFDYTARRVSFHRPSAIEDLVFRMTLAHQLSMQVMTYDTRLWSPADPSPYMTDRPIRSMEDLRIFRDLPPEERDIIVPPPSFDEILQMALDHQAPKQKELREKARRLTKGDQIIRVSA